MLKIRTHLVLMTLSILLPAMIFSWAALQQLRDGEREAALRGLHETARAMALTIDRELTRSTTMLEHLGRSASLETGDLRQFYKEAAQLQKNPRSWIVLVDENGQQLINTARPFTNILPPSTGTTTSLARQVMATQKPIASNLLRGNVTKKLVTVLYVPVPAQGGTRYVLTQAFSVDFFDQAIERQHAPSDWLIRIIGWDGRLIAHNASTGLQVGQPVMAKLTAAASAQDKGLIRYAAPDGGETYDAFVHSTLSGWTVAVAAPAHSLEATGGHAMAIASVGWLLAVLMAVIAAAALGRQLVRAISDAANAAAALGQGALPQLNRSRVREINQLHAALTQASALLAHAQTARAQAEAERETLLKNEHLARHLAEDENASKDQFLAMLGHELRNPLAAINGACALSERQGDTPAAAALAMPLIRRQSLHLARLVDDLLDVNRMMSGKIGLKLEPINLAKKVSRSLDALRSSGRTEGYALSLSTEPVWVLADPTRLAQTISNLLVNALKFTPPGGSLALTVSASDGEAVFSVTDSGVGMPPELLPHVFDLFVQGDASLDRAQGGMGIGLALVRELVTLHGGTVQAESAGVGQGSTFTIRLPRIAEPETPAPAAPIAAPAAPVHPHWRILLIEDNDDARGMMRQLLAIEGHEVFDAATGTLGLQLARTQQHDLAIVDIGLPEMSGYDIAQHLRADPATHAIGLIALTGYGQEEDRHSALAAGFDFHLVKPTDINRLLEVIDQCGETARLRSQKPAQG